MGIFSFLSKTKKQEKINFETLFKEEKELLKKEKVPGSKKIKQQVEEIIEYGIGKDVPQTETGEKVY